MSAAWYAGLGSVLSVCRKPISTILCLLLTGYTKCLTLPDPIPCPETILHDRELVQRRYDGITALRKLSLFRLRDTPTMSLYRMYEFVCADMSDQLMHETNYFWGRSEWTLASIANPHDANNERQAVLASLVESLVSAFNKRTALGLRRTEHDEVIMESCPHWTADVPPLPQKLQLYEYDIYDEILGFQHNNSPFDKRNVVANAGNIWSI